MSIESKIPNGEINIKDLQVEEVETKNLGFVFDPERDIPFEQKQGIFSDAAIAPLKHLANIKILFPNEFKKIEDIVETRTREIPMRAAQIISLIDQDKKPEALEAAASLKQLYPNAHLYEDYFDNWYEIFAEQPSGLLPVQIDEYVRNCKILYPDKTPFKNLGMSESTADILRTIRKIREENDSIEALIDCLYTLKIVAPDKFKALDFIRQDWKGRDERRGYIDWLNNSLAKQTPSIVDYTEYAKKLYVIAADKLELTRDNFAVINKKDISEGKHNLPKVKKF